MLLRNPQPDPDLRRKFNETETIKELPALPQNGLHPSWYQQPATPLPAGWQNDSTKSPWTQVRKEQIDLEKWAARIMWACMGTFTLLITCICLWKVVLMVLAIK